jgi:hypothetical protein
LRSSAGKVSRSGGKSEPIDEKGESDEDDSLVRDEEDQPDYSNDDFVSESIHSGSISESKNL